MTTPETTARARIAVFVLLVASAIAALAYWVRLGWPMELAAAPAGRISCVSYAPYRKPGESPFTPGYLVSAARIEEDLTALSRRFDCVRTYSVGQGLDQVPAIARRHGMKVLLGAWLSRNPVENAEELAAVIRVANEQRDVIRAIVVGNEVLLRGELPQRTLAEHVRLVKAATHLPVTYADVWEFWLKYREVAPAVDFLTIHILPYWEDEPVAIENAVGHVDAIYKHMQAAFPGREFLIGETGWPSAGRQRWRAVPSRVNEARFFREFIAFVEHAKLPYNVIEAFDQPWKRLSEGTVGGYWGLYDDDLHDKFGLVGPVVEEPRWWIGLVCAAVVAAACVLAGRRAGGWSAPLVAARAAYGLVVGALAAAEGRHLVMANRTPAEWWITGAASAVALLTVVVVGRRIARSLAGDPSTAGCAPMVAALAVRRGGSGATGRAAGVLQAFWLVAMTVVNLLLIFDSRYRDFPSLLFAPVVFAFVLSALLCGRLRIPWRRLEIEVEERFLGGAAVVGAALIVVLELPINASADWWAALCVAFAAAAVVNAGGPTPMDVRPARSGAASTGIAPGPARRS